MFSKLSEENAVINTCLISSSEIAFKLDQCSTSSNTGQERVMIRLHVLWQADVYHPPAE